MFPHLSKEQPMKCLRLCLLVVLSLSIISSAAFAAGGVMNAPGFPKAGAKGTILASGTYTADGGWQLRSVTIYVTPANPDPMTGSVGYQGPAMAANGSFTGQVTGVAAGDYKVFVRAFFLDAASNVVYIDTPQTAVTVASCGCEPED
jgi:hypothetical protein